MEKNELENEKHEVDKKEENKVLSSKIFKILSLLVVIFNVVYAIIINTNEGGNLGDGITLVLLPFLTLIILLSILTLYAMLSVIITKEKDKVLSPKIFKILSLLVVILYVIFVIIPADSFDEILSQIAVGNLLICLSLICIWALYLILVKIKELYRKKKIYSYLFICSIIIYSGGCYINV